MKSLLSSLALWIFIGTAPAQTPAIDAATWRQELKANPRSSLAHFRLGEALLQQNNPEAAAIEFSSALNGDHEPAWTIVWSHINLGKIFQPHEPNRAAQEFADAELTGDNTGGAVDEAERLLHAAPHSSPVAHGTADDLPLPPDAWRIDRSVVAPLALRTVAAAYSSEALIAGLEGTVIVTGIIDAAGKARDMQVTRSLGLGLDEKALDAVAHWRFIPGRVADRPVPVFVSYAIDCAPRAQRAERAQCV